MTLLLDLEEQSGVLDGQRRLGRKRPQEFDDLRCKSARGLADDGEAPNRRSSRTRGTASRARYPARTRAPRTRLSAGASHMSRNWVGSRMSARRPVAPSPFRTGVAGIVSPISAPRPLVGA